MSPLPETIDTSWVEDFQRLLDECSRENVASLRKRLPKDVVIDIIKRVDGLLKDEPTLLEV